jgi:hypothetical protein
MGVVPSCPTKVPKTTLPQASTRSYLDTIRMLNVLFFVELAKGFEPPTG